MNALRYQLMVFILCMPGYFCGIQAQHSENKVLILDGFADRAVIRHPSPTGSLQEGTLEFWCRPDQADEASCLLRFLEPFLEVSIGFSPERNGMTILAFGSDWQQIASLDLIIEIEKWFHLSIVWSRTELSAYYNGELKARTILKAPLELPVQPFTLFFGGFEGIGKQYFAGQIDGIRLWKQPLTAGQVQLSMKGTSVLGDADLLQSWDFDVKREDSGVSFEGDAHLKNQPTPVSWRWGQWHRLSGIVQTTEGEPVSGCSIHSESNSEYRLVGSTNPRGEFELFMEGDLVGRHLWFEHGTSRKRVVLEPLDARKELNFKVLLPPSHISVSGNVLTLDERMPVPGVFVEVMALNADGSSGRVLARDLTDHMGSYKLQDLPQGDYVIQVRDETLGFSSPYGEFAEHRRAFSVVDSTVHQRIDLRCPPQEAGDWDYFDNLDGLPGYGFTLTMDESNKLWVYSHQWLRLFAGNGFKEVVKIPAEWGYFGRGAAIPEGGLCVGSSGTDSMPPALHFFDTRQRLGYFPSPNQSTPEKVAFGPNGALYVLGANQVFLLEDWRVHLNANTHSIPWRHLETPSSNHLAIGPSGELWLAGPSGVTRIKGASQQTYEAWNGLGNVRINDLKIAMDGTVWLATSRGLGQLRNERFHWVLNDGKPWGSLNSLALGPNGEAWAGTISMGILKITKSSIIKIDDPAYPIHGTVSTIVRGPGKTLFVSTPGALRRYRPKRLERFDEAHGLPPEIQVLSISASNESEKVILGTAWHGPQFFNGRQFKSLPKNHLFGKSYVRSMGFTPEGNPWMCTNFGLSMIKDFDILPATQESALSINDHFTTCAFDSDGEAWIGRGWAGGGLIHLEPMMKDYRIFGKKDGLRHENIWAVDIGKDDILRVGTEQGLFEYDGMAFHPPKKASELATVDVYGIESLPNGNIWAATSKGVFGLRSGEEIKLDIPTLPDTFMTLKVFVDSEDILWIATDAYGAVAYDGQIFTHYSIRTDLPSNTIYDIREGPDRTIWMATSAGAARLRHRQYTPRLNIARASIKGVPLDIQNGQAAAQTGQPIDFDLEWSHICSPRNELLVVANISNGKAVSKHLFKHRLSDGDVWTWTPAESGIHSLELVLRDSDFNRSGPVSATFNVSRPWTEDPWKKTGVGMGLLLVFATMGAALARNIQQRRRARQNEVLMLNQERRLRTDLERKNKELVTLREAALSAAGQAKNANQAKSLFVASMSHEIRSPLNAVLGYAQILKRDHALHGAPLHAVNAIEKSGQHLLNLIDDMLDLSRIESGRWAAKPVLFTLTDMTKSLSDFTLIHCDKKGLRWSLRWFEYQVIPPEHTSSRSYIREQPSFLWANADEARLKQILLNLLFNAVKFTERGEVRLEIGLPAHWNNPHVSWRESTVYFEVIDTGRGIVQEEMENIMNPFSQGRDVAQIHGGVGLGLAISRRLAEAFNGTIEVESAPGEGSRFHFTARMPLLVKSTSSTKTSQSGPRNLQAIKPVRALVADDIGANRDILTLMLRGVGLTVDEAASGREALDKARQCRPDFVFLDIAMPELDGFQTLKHLRAMEESVMKRMVICAVTAGVMDRAKESYLEAGFDDFIPKPVRMEKLYDSLIQLMPQAFKASESRDDGEPAPKSIWFDPETNRHFLELAETYAVTEIVRYAKSLAKNASPECQKNVKEVIQLAKLGCFDELIRKLMPQDAAEEPDSK